MRELVSERPLDRSRSDAARSDPVCGMAIDAASAATSAEFDGRTYLFCSERCRARFLMRPDRYVS